MENKLFRKKHGRLKKCFVPRCENNTDNAPNKLFIRLPVGAEKRRKWAEAVGRTGKNVFFNHDSSVYCCEDHFNLSEDAENLMYYNIMGGNARLKLKPGVLPHIFQCQSGDLPAQHGDKILEKALQKDAEENVTKHIQQQPALSRIEELLQATSSTTSFFDEYMERVAKRSTSSAASLSHKDIQCNLMPKKPHVRSKSTSIDVKFLCCSATCSTTRKATVDAATSPIGDPDFLNMNINPGTSDSLAIKEEPIDHGSIPEESSHPGDTKEFDKYEFIKVESFHPDSSFSSSQKVIMEGSEDQQNQEKSMTLDSIPGEQRKSVKLEITDSADFGVWNTEPFDCKKRLNNLTAENGPLSEENSENTSRSICDKKYRES